MKARRERPSKRWRRPSRARACGDVTSGAEEAEWCSEGQTKGGAGGAQRPAAGRNGGGAGLPAGRPDRAGPGEWVGRGKGRELSLLETHSYTPPASCLPRAPRAARALPTAAGSLGASRGSSVWPTSWLPRTPGLRGPTLFPVPRRASPLPGTPVPPCALHTGSFRLGSPRSPCHPLGSPRS